MGILLVAKMLIETGNSSLQGTANVRNYNKLDTIMQEAQKHMAIQKQIENIKSPMRVARDMRIRQTKIAT